MYYFSGCAKVEVWVKFCVSHEFPFVKEIFLDLHYSFKVLWKEVVGLCFEDIPEIAKV